MFALTDGYSVTKTREDEREKTIIKLAKKMLLDGDSVEKVVRITELAREAVLQLKESLKQKERSN